MKISNEKRVGRTKGWLGVQWRGSEGKDNLTNETSRIDYIFRDGLLRMKPIDRAFQAKNEVPETMKQRYFASWGWFEDIILASFFNLTSEGDGKKLQIQKIESKSDGKQNRCFSHKHLYTMGLDSVILPGKTHPIQKIGFKDFSNEDLIAAQYIYPKEARHELTRIYHIYDLIDRKFKNFEQEVYSDEKAITGPNGEKTYKKNAIYYYKDEDGKEIELKGVTGHQRLGIIRNMVFPMEMYQKHFSEMNSLRQGMRNFWSDVSNQYGGFWDFKVGQDADETQRIGVSDINVSEPKKPLDDNNESKPEDFDYGKNYDFINQKPHKDKTFKFEIYSKDSIVKSYDINLDLSPEAAVIARYGSNVSIEKSTGNTSLGLKAWNILNDNEITDKTYEAFKKAQESSYKNLNYPTIDGVGLGYESGEYDKSKSSSDNRKLVDNKGVMFSTIKSKTEGEDAEAIENERIDFIKGVGIYDKFGNFSNYFKGIMKYIINSANSDGSESMIQVSHPLIPVTLTMTLDGVGGLRVGDLFRSDYLPPTYKDFCYFMITKIDHKVSAAGWETTITANMIADLEKVWEFKKSNNPAKNKAREENYMDWFKLDTKRDLRDRIAAGDNPTLPDYQGKFDNFYNQLQDIENCKTKYNTKIKDLGPFKKSFRLGWLRDRIQMNIRQLNRAFRRIERPLSSLQDIPIKYKSPEGEQEGTGAEILKILSEKKTEVIKSIENHPELSTPKSTRDEPGSYSSIKHGV